MHSPENTFTDDSSSSASSSAPASVSPARVLFAVPEIEERVQWLALLSNLGHVPKLVDGYDHACRALAGDDYHVVVIHTDFAQEQGMRLARHISRCRLRAKVVLISEQSSFDLAVDALRAGVADIVRMPVADEQFRYSIEGAMLKSREERLQRDRIHRLRDMCRKLNTAKQESSRQVDSLCRDLAHAYEGIAEQISEAAMASEFRTLLGQELDLEQLLRTALEYMLTRTGPTNAAVFLPDPEEGYGLGAYVNWNCPRDDAETLLEQLAQTCPYLEDEPEVLRFDLGSEFCEWIGESIEFLDDKQVIAFRCVDGEETIALMILFRDASDPFDPRLDDTLDCLRAIFARQVSNVVRVHRRARPQWPAEPAEDAWDVDDEFGFAA